MNKIFTLKIIVSLFILNFAFNQNVLAEEYCTKNNSLLKMNYTEAYKLAINSKECQKVGKLQAKHWCNENSGTWWIGLTTKNNTCFPACVINLVDKSVYVNYMCMGLLPKKKTNK